MVACQIQGSRHNRLRRIGGNTVEYGNGLTGRCQLCFDGCYQPQLHQTGIGDQQWPAQTEVDGLGPQGLRRSGPHFQTGHRCENKPGHDQKVKITLPLARRSIMAA